MHSGVLTCVATIAGFFCLCVVANARQSDLVQANNKFAFSLYSQLCNDKTNMVVSPYSISAALAMTYAGSAGKTKQELRKVLGYTRMRSWFVHKSFRDLLRRQRRSSKDYTLYVANRIFANKKVRVRHFYQRIAMRYYGSSVKIMKFARSPQMCRRYINKWVSRKTGGMIRNLLGTYDVNRNTDLVLASAIYFKSVWKVPFDSAETIPDTFCLSDGSTIQVNMMIKRSMFNYGISKELGCHIVELPYKGDASMFIFLPWQIEGLYAMQKKMTTTTLNAAIDSLRRMLTNIYLPRFTLSSDVDLRKTLVDMGISHLFRAADLRGMSTNVALSITRVKHSATINVNERGTEASAATAVASTRSFGQPFIVDRPFAFIIREHSSGSILFMGHVKKPPNATTRPENIYINPMQKRTDMMMKRIMNNQRKKYMI